MSDRRRADDAKTGHEAEVVLQNCAAVHGVLGRLPNEIWNADAKHIFVGGIDVYDDLVLGKGRRFLLAVNRHYRKDDRSEHEARYQGAPKPSMAKFNPSHV
jgi:hypothetical protein